jgi:glycosyltransferase involved in cell wall biosynthesis
MITVGPTGQREALADAGPGQDSAELKTSGRLAGEPGWAWLEGCRVSVVIPTLNEAENLPHVLPRIPPWVHEVLLVDGLSTDGTAEIARRLWPEIRILEQHGRGKGAALRTGFAAAEGEIIVMLDADGSTDPAEIPAYLGPLLAGADLAKGTRFVQGGGTADMQWYRCLGNLGFVLLVRLLFGQQYTDLCYGYNAFWRRVLPQLALDADGFEIETLINLRALAQRLKITEVASFEGERIHGRSKLRTFPDGWRVLRTIFQEWRLSKRMGGRSTAGAGLTTPPYFPVTAVNGMEPLRLRPEDRGVADL